MTSIEKLISNLENELESAWQLPLSGGRILIDAKEIVNVIKEVKDNLPNEIVQAKKIVQDRSSIIEKAKTEAETMIKNSEEKARDLISQNEIVKSAKAKADQILKDATAKAREIRSSSDEYASNVMKNLDEAVTSSLTEIRKVRHVFNGNNAYSE